MIRICVERHSGPSPRSFPDHAPVVAARSWRGRRMDARGAGDRGRGDPAAVESVVDRIRSEQGVDPANFACCLFRGAAAQGRENVTAAVRRPQLRVTKYRLRNCHRMYFRLT